MPELQGWCQGHWGGAGGAPRLQLLPTAFSRNLLIFWLPGSRVSLGSSGAQRGEGTCLRSGPGCPQPHSYFPPRHIGTGHRYGQSSAHSVPAPGGPQAPKPPTASAMGASPELTLGTGGRADLTGAGGLCPSAQLAKDAAPLPFSEGQGQPSVPSPSPRTQVTGDWCW